MTQVKVFDCGKVDDLQKDINDFLNSMKSNSTFKLIDIKFNSYPWGESLTDYHSAMIIYEI